MPIAYIGLGSNLGNRQKNLDNALVLLEKENISILKRSSIMETNPVGGPTQGKLWRNPVGIRAGRLGEIVRSDACRGNAAVVRSGRDQRERSPVGPIRDAYAS